MSKISLLTGKELRHLRSQGNQLQDRIVIGKTGMTTNVLEQINQFLKKEELIKIRIMESSGLDCEEWANSISEQCQANVVQVFGHTVLLYRKNENKD